MSRPMSEPCSLCYGIVNHITRIIDEPSNKAMKEPPWYQTTQEILESGKSCLLCESLWQATILPRLKDAMNEVSAITPDRPLAVSIKFGSYKKANGLYWASFRTSLEAMDQKIHYNRMNSIGISYSIPQHPHWLKYRDWPQGSVQMKEDQLSLMKKWLQECQDDHPACFRPVRPEFLPLRLLDVRKDRGIRLVLSKKQGSPEIRYATLSHCWGDYLPIYTSQVTRATFEESISEDKLPRTFCDAVKIARYLDIPYLWIDSLCIVQDDLGEWQQEAAKMRHIYSGSVVTIAATEAKDSTGGCFLESSKTPTSSHLQLPDEGLTLSSDDAHAESYQSPRGPYVVSLDAPEKSSNIMVRVQGETPWYAQRSKFLSTRGWVMQEQLLSNRIVHCMHSEVHWQCRQIYKTQAGQVVDLDKLHEDAENFAYSSSKRRERMWCDWIEEYSTRNFTFPEDRIPALTGIVDHYANSTGDLHLLGLWKRTLARDLLWIRVGDVKGYAPSNIPSWTWLSCYAQIEVDRFAISMVDTEPKEDDVILIEGEVIWSGLPMTSSIKSTHLVISGPLQTLRFRVDPKSKGRFDPPYIHLEGEELDHADPVPWTCVGQFDGDDPSPGKYASYTCLLVRTRKHGDQGRFKEVFLVLEPVEDIPCRGSEEQPMTFCRIGLGCKRGASKKTFNAAKRRTIRLC